MIKLHLFPLAHLSPVLSISRFQHLKTSLKGETLSCWGTLRNKIAPVMTILLRIMTATPLRQLLFLNNRGSSLPMEAAAILLHLNCECRKYELQVKADPGHLTRWYYRNRYNIVYSFTAVIARWEFFCFTL